MFPIKELLKKKEPKPVDTAEMANIEIMSVSMHIPIISNESNQMWLPESWMNLKLKRHTTSSTNIYIGLKEIKKRIMLTPFRPSLRLLKDSSVKDNPITPPDAH